MSNAKLLTILTRHAIPAVYRPEMRAFVFDGIRPSSELLRTWQRQQVCWQHCNLS